MMEIIYVLLLSLCNGGVYSSTVVLFSSINDGGINSINVTNVLSPSSFQGNFMSTAQTMPTPASSINTNINSEAPCVCPVGSVLLSPSTVPGPVESSNIVPSNSVQHMLSSINIAESNVAQSIISDLMPSSMFVEPSNGPSSQSVEVSSMWAQASHYITPNCTCVPASSAYINPQASAGVPASSAYINPQASVGVPASSAYINPQASAGVPASSAYINPQASVGVPASSANINPQASAGVPASSAYINPQASAGVPASSAYVNSQGSVEISNYQTIQPTTIANLHSSSINNSSIQLNNSQSVQIQSSPTLAINVSVSVQPSSVNQNISQSIQISPSAVVSIGVSSSIAPTRKPHPPYSNGLNNLEGVQINGIIDLIVGEKIAISYDSSSNGKFELWKSGQWSKLQVVTSKSAVVVDGATKIRFYPDPAFHGVASFNYSLTYSVSQTIDTTSLTSYRFLMIVFPNTPVVKFTSNVTELNTTIQEDSGCNLFKLDSLIQVITPSNRSNIDAQLLSMINSTFLAQYNEALNAYSTKMKPAYNIRKVDINNGVWYYGNSTDTVKFKNRLSDIFTPSIEFCFNPSKDFVGVVPMDIGPVLIDDTGVLYKGTTSICINIYVTEVNDRPILQGPYIIDAPYIPFNLSDYDTTGITVLSVVGKRISSTSQTKVAEDPDGSLPGIAITNYAGNKYGSWEYYCNGTWQTLNISNSLPLGGSNSMVVVLLTPNNKIRFTLSGNTFWGKSGKDLYYEPEFSFVAWDQSDNQVCGKHTYNTTGFQPSPLSNLKNFRTMKQYRIGCALKPWTKDAIVDSCGVCGGDNSSCLGCDGVLNSGAVLDTCNNCTGGSTGLVADFFRDCLGECGLYYNDSCGYCQLKGTFVNYTDCNGVCGGSAEVSKCGVCVGGNTGKSVNNSMDACGVCNGDNSTCADCANVPNGGKVIDLCNKCIHPTDVNYNSECTSLGKFSPNVGYVTGDMKINLVASGLATYKTVTCSFNGASLVSAKSSKFVTVNGKKSSIEIETPASIAAGIYTISCVLGSDPAKTAIGTILFVDESSISVTHIQPNVTMVETAAVVMFVGTGFVNSTELLCLYGKKKEELQATYISSTSVSCPVPAQEKSLINDIYLSFVSYEREKHLSLINKHYIAVNVPYVISAAFDNQGASVHVKFSDKVSFVSKQITCQDVYPQNYSSFGAKYRCKFASDRVMKIIMLSGPTFTPGSLFIDLTKLKVKRSEHTIYPNTSQQFTVSGPSTPIVPKVELIGSSVLGVCDKMKLRVSIIGGSGGRKLSYKYSVTRSSANSGSANSLQSAALTSINSTLLNLPATLKRIKIENNASLIGATLTFKVEVTNFLGASSSSEFDVKRENRALPQLSMSDTKITRKVSEDITVKANAKISDCVDRSSFAAKLSFSWSIEPSVGVNLGKTDLPKLRIRAGQLKGDKTYTLTVVVAMAQDPTLQVTGSVELATLSSPLIPAIQCLQTVGAGDTLELYGGFSSDPDNSGDATRYIWAVTNTDKTPVVMNGKVITLPEGQKISVNVRQTLPSKKTYIISLKYRVGSRVATTTKNVYVAPGSPPSVKIRPIGRKVNPSRNTRIRATLKSSTSCDYEWSSESVAANDYATIDLSADQVITRTSGSFNGRTTVVLVLKADILSGNTYYRFKLTATNADDTATATIDIKTNGVPSPGVVTISPSQGLSLNTTFTISLTEGCTDPDGDAVFYRFGIKRIQNNVEELQLFQPQSDNVYSLTLASGNWTAIVKCIDSQKAFSMNYGSEVFVEAMPISSAAFDNFGNTMQDLADSGDVNQLAGLSITIMTAAQSNGGQKTTAEIAFQSSTTTLMSDKADGGALQDENAKDQAAGSFAKLTMGGKDNFDKSTILKVLTAMLNIIGGSSSGSRKRRALTGSSATEKTPVQVEQSLSTYVNLIDPLQFDSTTQSSKTALLNALDTFAQSMCVNLSPGEAARVAKSSLVVVSSVNKEFNDVDTQYVELGCTNCSTYMNGPNHVLFGAYMKSLYESFSCDSNTQCTSLCVSSYIMANDLLSSSLNTSIMSSVVAIKLFNPQTYDDLAVSDITYGSVFKLLATKATNNSYLCHRWDSSSTSWTLNDVDTVTPKGVTTNSLTYISCNVTKLGYLALFEGPAIIEPTVSSTPVVMASTSIAANETVNITSTQVANINATPSTVASMASSSVYMTTTPLPRKNYPRKCKLTFPGNCTLIFNETTKASIALQIKNQIATAAKINVNTMTKFNISCGSIVSEWEQTYDSNNSTEEIITSIQNAVSAGSVNITINGQKLSADTASFQSTIVEPQTTVAPTSKPDDDLSDGAIAGIVIGVFVAVILIVVLVYVLCIRKKTRKDPTVEPNDNDLELRGKSNQGYHDESI